MDLALFIPIIAIISNFAAIIIWVYLYYTSRHRERMALIERGVDASIFKVNQDPTTALKYGIVLVLAGIGVLMGYLLESIGLPAFVAYFSMILIFSGTGLVGFYSYAQKKFQLSDQV